jgi:hypothetical protein
MYDSHEVKEAYEWRAVAYDAACAVADSAHADTPEEYFTLVQEALNGIPATPPRKRKPTEADLEDIMTEFLE